LQLRAGAKDHRHDAVSLLNLDPDIRRFVEEMTAAWARHPDLGSVSFPEARRIAEEVRAPWRRGGPTVASTETTIAGVRVRLYGWSEPVLIYLHGGGWTLFSIDTHDRLMREYAARAGVTVIGVDYALAPEAKYPVALEQVVAVAQSVAQSATAIAIGGDSAGANLAIAACMRQPGLFRAMVLNYGVFDRHSSKEARERLGGPGNMVTAEEMDGFWRNYLRDERDADDPFVCPLRGDLRGLPPALIVVPEYDLLAEQSVQLADRLPGSELRIYRGAVHSFLEAVSIAPLADRALEESASWLRANLAL
jgi:acetyl esterase